MTSSPRAIAAACAIVLGIAIAQARSFVIEAESFSRGPFELLDPPIVSADALARGPDEGRREAPAWLSGSAVAVIERGALVLDADSGELVRTDRAGRPAARTMIGPGAAQLVFDPVRALVFATHRERDQIAVVRVGGQAHGLSLVRRFATRAEPYGVALTPDRATLLVTCVADRQLVAYDADTGRELWAIEVGPEPRGVAIAPGGAAALVTFLTTGAVARVSLSGTPALGFAALGRHQTSQDASSPSGARGSASALPTAGSDHGEIGRGHARAAFAARWLSDDIAVVAHQESTPRQSEDGQEDSGVYGGGRFAQPVEHRLSFLAARGTPGNASAAGATETSTSIGARIAQVHVGAHQPRAIAYDAPRDVLYVAGYGSDDVYAIGGVTTPGVRLLWQHAVDEQPCGPSGVAVTERGELLVFCALSRRLAVFGVPAVASERAVMTAALPDAITIGPELSRSRLSGEAQRGLALFRHGGNQALSREGALACSSCHPEVRTDGLSWRIGGASLQTPILAGRVIGTHPYKWDGGDATLPQSLRNTVTRLGGSGITNAQASALEAYLASLLPPRAPRARDRRAVARGRAIFARADVGCARCHSGAALTDRERYDLAARPLPASGVAGGQAQLDGKVDTPSLLGLSVSAPYFHDGSAATLRAVLLEAGTVHGMGDTEDLSERELADLLAYLQTL